MASNVPFTKNTLAAGLRINERGALVQEDQFCMQCPSLFSLAHYPAYPSNFAFSGIPCQLAGSGASSFVRFACTTVVLITVSIAVIEFHVFHSPVDWEWLDSRNHIFQVCLAIWKPIQCVFVE